MPPDAIPPDPHALLDVLERVLDDGERPPEWPTVHRQLAPLVGVAHVALSFDGRRRLRTWLRDARDHPTLYALGLALALRTAGDAEATVREALERVRALNDPATIGFGPITRSWSVSGWLTWTIGTRRSTRSGRASLR